MNSLRRLVRALRITAHGAVRNAGTSAAQLFVLRQIALSPGQSVSELTARTLTTQSTTSEVVARLVEAGLVRRRASEGDARRAELTLTARGAAAVDGAPETAQERLVASLARLSAAERRTLADAMERWLDVAGFTDTPATMFFERTTRRRAGATE
jgi:DNA-binding MarR family transcriptional regulator